MDENGMPTDTSTTAVVYFIVVFAEIGRDYETARALERLVGLLLPKQTGASGQSVGLKLRKNRFPDAAYIAPNVGGTGSWKPNPHYRYLVLYATRRSFSNPNQRAATTFDEALFLV